MPPDLSRERWDELLGSHPEAHLLQTSEWGELKGGFGWQVVRIASGDVGAQLLIRRLPLGLSLAYLPKGPPIRRLAKLLPELDAACRAVGAFTLKIEPDELDDREAAEELGAHGFMPSPHAVQPRRTLIVDLSGSEEDVLARMHQKTRYNIHLASRREVTVRAWEDPDAFGQMMLHTATRDGFGAHQPEYYAEAYRLFHRQQACALLLAELQGAPLAALMVFARGERAWYLFGASFDIERQRMPTYLLQWEAMRWARERGCKQYDLWGVPDVDFAELERDFTRRSDGLWGVYRFKRGFGGSLVRWTGAWDRVYRPIPYRAYRLLERWRRMEG